MFNFRVLYFILLGLLVSCASPKEDDRDIIVPAVSTYNNAKALLEKGKYKKAAEEFAGVYYQHPGGLITPYAELMEAYSYYLDKKYEDCVDILNSFIKLHPVHEDIAYAYYLKALAAYHQMSDVYYDQSATIAAIDALTVVKDRFPGTPYAQDIADKLVIANDYLAAKNLEIGRYYLDGRNNPIAAIVRFKEVAESNSDQSPEALYRLQESFLLMGFEKEARQYVDELQRRFPNSSWYEKAKKRQK
jgi:outer membrane protein assembly factor BamD